MKMKIKAALVVAAMAMLVLGTLALASDTVTVEGKIACAKCTLKVEGQKDCQNVLVVKGEKGDPTWYYLVKNDVVEAYGHVCQGEKPAVATGTVETKDGKTWLTATKMEAPKAS